MNKFEIEKELNLSKESSYYHMKILNINYENKFFTIQLENGLSHKLSYDYIKNKNCLEINNCYIMKVNRVFKRLFFDPQFYEYIFIYNTTKKELLCDVQEAHKLE